MKFGKMCEIKQLLESRGWKVRFGSDGQMRAFRSGSKLMTKNGVGVSASLFKRVGSEIVMK